MVSFLKQKKIRFELQKKKILKKNFINFSARNLGGQRACGDDAVGDALEDLGDEYEGARHVGVLQIE